MAVPAMWHMEESVMSRLSRLRCVRLVSVDRWRMPASEMAQ